MKDIKTIAFDLIARGQPRLARRLQKVTAFDTRFTLHKQPDYENEHIRHIYLLDVPLFDKHFEAVMEDGTRKLLSDDDAIKILKTEKDYLEKLKDTVGEQHKNTLKFAKMGELEGIAPPPKPKPEPTQEIDEEKHPELSVFKDDLEDEEEENDNE